MEIGDIYMVRARHISSAGRCYLKWEELSVNHFLNIVTIGNEH